MNYAYFDDDLDTVMIVNFDPTNIGVTESFPVAETITPNEVYIQSGALFFYPPKPKEYMVYDYALHAWADTRTLTDWMEQLVVAARR